MSTTTYKTSYTDPETGLQVIRDCTPEEVAQIEKDKAATANDAILAQITSLEYSITSRRMRESVLTTTGKDWLTAIDTQIFNLRKTLVK